MGVCANTHWIHTASSLWLSFTSEIAYIPLHTHTQTPTKRTHTYCAIAFYVVYKYTTRDTVRIYLWPCTFKLSFAMHSDCRCLQHCCCLL